MTPEEFRVAGHHLIDWIADHRSRLETMPVRGDIKPGQVKDAFDLTPPDNTTDILPLLDVMNDVVVPGLTQVQHPMHFGWFPSNASLSSVLGDMASSGLGSLGISWESSPALTEVEEVMCDWLRQLVGLSSSWSSTIHDTASTSCVVALILGREKASDDSYAAGGLTSCARPPVVYCSSQAHSSVRKAALLAGFGSDNVHVVGHDADTFAMKPDLLAEAVEADVAEGRAPAAVVATVGTTATTAIDPLEAITAIASDHGLWVHVDAAMAGSAMVLPECRHLWSGVEQADSITWNPHKWLGTILDTSLFLVRDPEYLVQVMSTNPSYLMSKADGAVVQYRDWGIPLGRRFRSLKILFQLRLDGIEAIQARLRRDLDNAQWLADQAEAEPEWEVVAPVPLQTVCVIHRPPAPFDGSDLEALNEHTRRWVERINSSGHAYLTPTLLDGRWVARVSVGVEGTERHHLERMWHLMKSAVT